MSGNNSVAETHKNTKHLSSKQCSAPKNPTAVQLYIEENNKFYINEHKEQTVLGLRFLVVLH